MVLTAQVGGIRVHAIEVRRPFDKFNFLFGEFWESGSQHLTHVWRIMTEIYRILHTALYYFTNSFTNCVDTHCKPSFLNASVRHLEDEIGRLPMATSRACCAAATSEDHVSSCDISGHFANKTHSGDYHRMASASLRSM